MFITAFFAKDGVPETGLSSVTIRIRKISDNSLVITDEAMSEVGDGSYKYDFTTYDGTIDYVFRCDGGNTLPDSERYTYGSNESFSQDIADNVWLDQPSGLAIVNNILQSPTILLDSKDIDRGADWDPRFELEVTDSNTKIKVDITDSGGSVLSKATANVSGGNDDQVKLIATGDAFLIYRIYISATETSLFGSGAVTLNITSTLSDSTVITRAYRIPTSSTSAIQWNQVS